MRVTSLSDAATVAIVVHGVGDHSLREILVQARLGAAAMGEEPLSVEDVTIAGLSPAPGPLEPSPALRISAAGKIHFLLPVVWSRLRVRAAKEADLYGGERAQERFFNAVFLLLPSSVNALRCIVAATGLLPRALTTIIAILYAFLAPGIAAAGFLLIVQLTYARAEADRAGYAWWRAPALIIGIFLLGWVAKKLLMVLDFVGDVVGYVGSPKHREKAEETLLGIIREVARLAPYARILLVGHSLGTVLVTHTLLRLRGENGIGRRLGIVTMGSPLRLMHWFFPDRIRSPEQLLREFEERSLAASWINLWRDADSIGRGLTVSGSSRFAETSLGDGTHPGYWSDSRCWAAVVKSLRSIANGTWDNLVSEWACVPMSQHEEDELIRRAQAAATFAVTLNLLVIAGPIYFWQQIREQNWLVGLDPWSRFSVLGLSALITSLACGYYYFASKRVGGDGATRRQMLGRYRLNWSAAMTCLKAGAILSIAASFVYWRSTAG